MQTKHANKTHDMPTTKVARLLGVSATMVREYAKLGHLSAVTQSGGNGKGQRLYFDPIEVAAFFSGQAPAAAVYRRRRDFKPGRRTKQPA